MGKHIHLDHDNISKRNITNAITEAYKVANEYVDCSLQDNKILMPIYDDMTIEFSYSVGKFKSRLLNASIVNVERSKSFDSDNNVLSLINRVFALASSKEDFYTNVVFKAKNVAKKEVYINVNVYDRFGNRVATNQLLTTKDIHIVKKKGGFVEYPDRTIHDRLKVRGSANKKTRTAMYANVISLKKW